MVTMGAVISLSVGSHKISHKLPCKTCQTVCSDRARLDSMHEIIFNISFFVAVLKFTKLRRGSIKCLAIPPPPRKDCGVGVVAV
jgi:hypothetical protein